MISITLNRPAVQNLIAGLVLCGTVGLYNAIASLGAGAGKPNSVTMNYIVSSSLYGIFAISGFFSGSVINRFGPKWSIFVSSTPCDFNDLHAYLADKVIFNSRWVHLATLSTSPDSATSITSTSWHTRLWVASSLVFVPPNYGVV